MKWLAVCENERLSMKRNNGQPVCNPLISWRKLVININENGARQSRQWPARKAYLKLVKTLAIMQYVAIMRLANRRKPGIYKSSATRQRQPRLSSWRKAESNDACTDTGGEEMTVGWPPPHLVRRSEERRKSAASSGAKKMKWPFSTNISKAAKISSKK